MKKERKRPKSIRAISWRIIVLALALWLGAMGVLTWAVASDMYMQLDNEIWMLASAFSDRENYSSEYSNELSGTEEVVMINRLGYPYLFMSVDQLLPIVMQQLPSGGIGSDEWLWGKWDLAYGFEAAAAFYDEDGELLIQSGNYLTFVYTSEENWRTGNPEPLGRGYIDVDSADDEEGSLKNLLSDHTGIQVGLNLFLTVLRLEGYFEDNEFHPVTVARGSCFDVYAGDYVSDVEKLCQLGLQNRTEWDLILDAENDSGRELETIYVWDFGGSWDNYEPLTVNGETFSGLPELLHADQTSGKRYRRESLLDGVIICSVEDEDSFGPYRYAVAVRCWPLQYAAFRLIWVYLISFILTALGVWLILRRIYHNLSMPLRYVAEAARCGMSVAPASSWREVYDMETYYEESRQELVKVKTELQQTRKALDYAHHAEESRRQLVSNITHELKTPLAVIHSYAEGLQAGISEEKREYYLSVILEEAERMDAMVLQMLDLSRLEAGKIRLAADQFSLLKLTRSVVDKFAPMLEEKGLELRFEQAEDFRITADEGRIRQVVTNLVSNALKYTDKGGLIRVKIYRIGRTACFDIQNTAEPLSEQAQLKVWDSFYRVDPSRTEPGTGLGLTLVKNIVELHRGSCHVRNVVDKTADPVYTGVEFGFELPMS